MSHPQQLVQKLWNYCNILRDDGLSYGDYVEQLTFLLFLKMADEQSRPPFSKPSAVPQAYSWPSLLARDGAGAVRLDCRGFEVVRLRVDIELKKPGVPTRTATSESASL